MPHTIIQTFPCMGQNGLRVGFNGHSHIFTSPLQRQKPQMVRFFDYLLFFLIQFLIKGTHRPSRWFFICACKALLPAAPNRRIANLASAFLLLAARKRATRVGKAKLRTQFILFQLFLYVIPNLLFVLAYRIHVVAPAPEFTIAVFELQIAKSFIQHQAAFTLQIPHKSRHTHLGWYLQQHMYMIRAAFRFENCHSFPFTKPAQYLADLTLLFPIENLSAIFGGKYHMVFAVPFCVG